MSKITKSSTAEYFAKNLQQVGFSSPLKAVLTTLKEAIDNSLDACEQEGILPEIKVEISKVGTGSTKNTDLIRIVVEDNGPGIDADDLAKVFGEYLASSKFGRGQCSRGQQGIGISAATTWAQMTNARGALVISKTKTMRKAVRAQIDVDIKTNMGILKNKESIDWTKPNGVRVEFVMDGRVQLNGDGGLLTYVEGTVLVNPHLTIDYKLMDNDWQKIERVTDVVPELPPATLPHPHTFKLGEFMTHATLFGKTSLSKFLKTGFSRISDPTINDFVKNGLPKSLVEKPVTSISEENFKAIFSAIQKTELMPPSTKSVLTVGEEALAKSIQRLGQVDFFSVVTRKPRICDFKPVVVEVALARFIDRGGEMDSPVQLLRFANRVPLQFDKSGCAITGAVESVNWKSYGLNQPKDSLPLGPYVFAISVVSPFIKFKNASKETIDASDDLVDEIRKAAQQAGQKLSRHIRKEFKEADLERKLAHIEQFGPILVEKLALLSGANESRRLKAENGLRKILGRDSKEAILALEEAETKLNKQKEKEAKRIGFAELEEGAGDVTIEDNDFDIVVTTKMAASTQKSIEKSTQKSAVDTTQKSTEKSTKKSVENATEKSTQKSVKASTQKGTQKAK